MNTNASDTGIGGVLSQEQDDFKGVITYHSRSLTKPERQYCNTRRELFALVAVSNIAMNVSGQEVELDYRLQELDGW